MGGKGCAGQRGIKGEKWDNYNTIINKIYLKKKSYLLPNSYFIFPVSCEVSRSPQLAWVASSRKQSLSLSLACRRVIKECAWGQHLQKGGDKSRSFQEALATDVVNTWSQNGPSGIPQVETRWPSFYFHISQPVDMGSPERV